MASADDSIVTSSNRWGFKRILRPIGKDSAVPLLPSPPGKKKGFASLGFRGLGCSSSSSSQAYAPAAAAIERPEKTSGRRRRRSKNNREERRNEAAVDVWCSPGIAAFAAESSVESVVESRYQMTDRRSQGAERIVRERPCIERRGSKEERTPDFMDSPPTPGSPLFVSDLLSSGHFRHMRGYHRCSRDRFEEVMMTRILLGGGIDIYDRFKDWRLDVDKMSYEELVELGDRIGYVSTGLREEEIVCGLEKMKHSILDDAPSLHFPAEMECRCSICQEDYEVNDEMGKLECGHSYHIYCIKEWLLQKNACPVCKTAVAKT